jgi:hypothetical protein
MAKAEQQSSTQSSVPQSDPPKDKPDAKTRPDPLAPVREHYWNLFQAGMDWALFELVVWYIASGRAPPAEITTEFVQRYDRWLKFEVRTLDEAFKMERPKGLHISDRAIRERYRFYIAGRVAELHRGGAGMPIDRGLFDTIAAEIVGGGMSGALAEKIYYESSEHYRRVAAALFRESPKNENAEFVGIPIPPNPL